MNSEFKFYVRPPGAASSTVLRDYGAEATITWTVPSAPSGRWELIVHERQVGSTAPWETYATTSHLAGTVCNLATLSAKPGAGATMDLSATASCGTASAEFRFYARAKGAASYQEVRPFSSASDFSWDTTGFDAGPYDLLVYARAAGNLSTYEAYATASQSVGPVCTAVTLTAAPPGSDLLELTAWAECGGLPAEYRIMVKPPGAATLQELLPWSPDPSRMAYLDQLGLGRFELVVYARALGNTSAYESTATVIHSIGTVCTAAALTASPPGSSQVELHATAQCGGAEPEYRFLVRLPGSAAFQELSAWSSSPNWTENLDQLGSGRYELMVHARASGNASSFEASATVAHSVGTVCTLATLTASPPGSGQPDLNATARCGGAVPEYRFLVRPPGAPGYQELRAWSTDPHAVALLDPLGFGRFDLMVYTRAKGNASAYEATSSIRHDLGPVCAVATLAVTPPASASVSLDATAECGGATPEYRFMVRPPGAAAFEELIGWTLSPSWWVNALDVYGYGRSELMVYARAAGNQSAYEASATVAHDIGETCSAATLTATPSGSSYPLLDANAMCGSAMPEYRFMVRPPGASSYQELRPWSSDRWTYANLDQLGWGRYDLMVYVRAAGNASQYEASASVVHDVGQVCTVANLSATPAGGSSVALQGTAFCGGAQPEYRYLVRPPGAAAFQELRPWSIDGWTMANLDQLGTGRFELAVHARAVGNGSAYEASATVVHDLGPVCTAATLTDLEPSGPWAYLLATAQCGGAEPEYRFMVRPPGAAAFQELRAWSPDPWSPGDFDALGRGRFEVTVHARAMGNASASEATATVTHDNAIVCTSASLSATPPGSATPELNATAVCGGASPEYRFLVRPPGAAAFQELRSWSPDPRASADLYRIGTSYGRFDLMVQARAAGNTSLVEASATFAHDFGLVCSVATLTATPPGSGSVALNATARCEGPPEYRFMVRPPGAAAFQELRPWSPDPLGAANFEQLGGLGRYELMVYARVQGNGSPYEASAKVVHDVGQVCTRATLAATPSGSANVNLAATAECGGAQPEYRFLVRPPGAAAFRELRSWSSEPFESAYLDPYGQGRFELMVYARVERNLSAYEASATIVHDTGPVCSVATLAATPPGSDRVDLAATAECGGVQPEYRFLVRSPGAAAFQELRSWSYEPIWTANLAPLGRGRFELMVYARATGSGSLFEASAKVIHDLGPVCTAATLTASPPGVPYPDLMATAECGGAQPEYRFLVRPPGAAVYKEFRTWSSDPHASVYLDQGNPGRHDLMVYARAMGNSSAYEAAANTGQNIGTACVAATLTATRGAGSNVELAATADCMGAPVEYRFLSRAPGASAYREVRGYGSGASVTWDAAGAPSGRHDFLVHARVLGNLSGFEAAASSSTLVGTVCTAATLSVNPSPGAPAELAAVDLAATASCGGAPVEYQFLLRPPGVSAYLPLGPYGPLSTFTWATAGYVEGRHELLVYARVAGNSSSVEASASAGHFIGQVCRGATLAVGYDNYGNPRLSATGTCDPGIEPSFRFLTRPPGSAAWRELQPWSLSSLASWTPGQIAGRHEFVVYVRNSWSQSQFEATASAGFNVGWVCGGVALTARPGVGTNVVLTATPTCSGVQAEYRFLRRPPGASAYQEIRAYGEGTSVSWDAAGAPSGRHDFLVYARAVGNLSTYESSGSAALPVGTVCTSATLTATPGPGSLVDLAATATCGGSPAEYQFLVRSPGESAYRPLGPYGAASGFSWDTAGLEQGRHELLVYARVAGNGSWLEASAGAGHAIGDVCRGATLTVTDDGSGEVTLSATSTCDGGFPADYRFLTRAPGAATWQEINPWGYGPVMVHSMTYLPAGRHEFMVYVRVPWNRSIYEASATAAYANGTTCTAARLTASPALGSLVELVASAECGGAPAEYRFFRRAPGAAAYQELRPYGASDRFSWDAAGASSGRHDFLVYARVAGNSSAWEAYVSTSYMIGSVCTATTLTATQGEFSKVDLYASATCGGLPAEYRFLAKPPGAVAFQELRSYGAPSMSWDTAGIPGGSYTLRVHARVVGNGSTYEAARDVGWTAP